MMTLRRGGDEIKFSNPDIFGKGFSRITKGNDAVVVSLVSQGILSFDGSIDLQQDISQVDKKLLWQYMRYLWHHNHSKPELADEFKEMTLKNTAHARGFVARVLHRNPETVTTMDGISISQYDIANYINQLIKNYSTVIEIPILSNLMKVIMSKLGQDTSFAYEYYMDGQQATHADASSQLTTILPVTIKRFEETNADGQPVVLTEDVSNVPVKLDKGDLTIYVKV